MNTVIDCTVPSGSPEGAGFFEELSDCQLAQKYSAPLG